MRKTTRKVTIQHDNEDRLRKNAQEVPTASAVACANRRKLAFIRVDGGKNRAREWGALGEVSERLDIDGDRPVPNDGECTSRPFPDGDGSITTYVDRYNTFKKPTYVYTRRFVSLVSASPRFLEWIRATVQRLAGLAGHLTVKRSTLHSDLWCLRYAKRESLALLRWIYREPNAPCLGRKRKIAAEFLVPRTPSLHRGPGRPVVL
jgi:hypothetical protein